MLDVRSYRLVSDQIEYPELSVVIRELTATLQRTDHGDIVELGCYCGTTSLFLERAIQDNGQSRQLHVYDSFSGLPEKQVQDYSLTGEQFTAGALQTSKQLLVKHFRNAGLRLPIIHKAWFEHLTVSDMPHSIAFAFLDGDFYSSIDASLRVIENRLTNNACIVIDDYHTEALPGAKRAVDTWAAQHNKAIRVEQSLAIIRW